MLVVASFLGNHLAVDSYGASSAVKVTPGSLPDLDLGIRVEVAPVHLREYVYFKIILPKSSRRPGIDKCFAQIGGNPGVAASADVWCEVEITALRWEAAYVTGVKYSLIEGSFFVLKVGPDTYALDLWEFLLFNTPAILKGTLQHGNTCANDQWRSADIIVERMIKGDPKTVYRIPVVAEEFPSGMKGIWMIYMDKSQGCDDDLYYRLIKFIPESRAGFFERRIGRYLREK